MRIASEAVERGVVQPTVTDEVLVARLAQRDRRAADELVARYEKPLFAYLRRLTGNAPAAEDIYQQTWFSVLQNHAKFDAGAANGGFKAWLFRIATNKATDAWRSQRREKNGSRTFQTLPVRAPETPDFRLELGDDLRRLEQAIEQLPGNQREVLLLRYYSNLKFVEIAELLGCPLNTALGRMHKAMQKLKSLLSADEPAQGRLS